MMLFAMIVGCSDRESDPAAPVAAPPAENLPAAVAPRPEIYANVELTADLSQLSEQQRQMLVLLIEASNVMDDLFWKQSFREDYADWLASIGVAETRQFAEMNYGPWDRLAEDKPFMDGFGEKPLGANFYPHDMTVEEFEAATLDGKRGLYSLIRRDESGALTVVPFHVAYAAELTRAATLLRDAADLSEHEGFADYLRLRAEALVTDDYRPSDFAWMDMKTNPIELVIGAIETYEDRLFGYKAAYESYVLLKDQEWSERLAMFSQFLPELQEGLPVPD